VDLYSLTLTGFRRFEDAWINLDGKAIAILGPNESGKSSLLKALTLFNDESGVPGPWITRGPTYPAGHVVAHLRFRLSRSERSTIPWRVPGEQGIWLIVSKTAEGPRQFAFEPPVTRPKQARAKARKGIDSMLAKFRSEPAPGEESEVEPDELHDALQSLRHELDSDADTLTNEALGLLEETRNLLKQTAADVDDDPALREAATRIGEALDAAAKVERLPSPEELARNLGPSMPTFLEFDDDNRDLLVEYDISKNSNFNAAFRNLAKLGGLDVSALRKAITESDDGKVRHLLTSAERKINTALKRGWNQSYLGVSFRDVGMAIRITLSSHESDFFKLDERSDGLRIFVALRAFLEAKGRPVKPILLVDEAERHLHYDAQVDLIRMFDQQKDAKEVVYTTHSVGCLPQDLGRGSRLVVSSTTGTRSTITNSWTSSGAGVSPLTAAMGARVLSLTPSRNVVITEGPSDASLLPSLIREATNSTALDYQMVAGLAGITNERVRWLEGEAARVIYLADGDTEGVKLAKTVRDGGVESSRVLSLPANLTLEELIEPQLYVDAVNNLLRSWPPNVSGITIADLSSVNRSAAVTKWCKVHGTEAPGKLAVGEEVIRMMQGPSPRRNRQWLDANQKPAVAALHGHITEAITKMPAPGTSPPVVDDPVAE
jgi:predicted ATP-dependent endonuclease of OLD family